MEEMPLVSVTPSEMRNRKKERKKEEKSKENITSGGGGGAKIKTFSGFG
jgi:hypothetical protein